MVGRKFVPGGSVNASTAVSGKMLWPVVIVVVLPLVVIVDAGGQGCGYGWPVFFLTEHMFAACSGVGQRRLCTRAFFCASVCGCCGCCASGVGAGAASTSARDGSVDLARRRKAFIS